MSSLSALVVSDGPMKIGSYGADVRALQFALSQAGYRVTIDPGLSFTADTDYWVRQFQRQHSLAVDGVVGPKTAAILDQSHTELVARAKPLIVAANPAVPVPGIWPHDDTASLISFYGDPRPNLDRWKDANVVPVKCPWRLFYEGREWPHSISFHRKAAPAFGSALNAIWKASGENDSADILDHVRNFSGSGEFRPVRGSSRLSCHAFWAAIDFDADKLPMGIRINASVMPQIIVDLFEATGAFWGGDYKGRPDPMHFQYAHE